MTKLANNEDIYEGDDVLSSVKVGRNLTVDTVRHDSCDVSTREIDLSDIRAAYKDRFDRDLRVLDDDFNLSWFD